MRRMISFICASAMLLAGAYLAYTLSGHVLHWPVIGSVGLAVIGLLWLWDDFVKPILRLDRTGGKGAQRPRADRFGGENADRCEPAKAL